MDLGGYEQKRTLEDKQNFAVIKANALVRQSRFFLTAQEQKIILYLVSKIKPNDKELSLYEFDINDFCKVCDIDSKNGKNYTNIKRTIKNLRDKSVWVTDDNGDETLYAWLDYAKIIKDSGIITLKINDLMKPYLIQLHDNYTQYTLYYALAMRSQYSIRLYEILKSYQHKVRIRFDIDDFKRHMGAEKYVQHNDFMRNVLTPAMAEIEELSDISVTYELHKAGRRFSHIDFKIKGLTAYEEFEKRHTKINDKLNKKQLKGQISLFEPNIPITGN